MSELSTVIQSELYGWRILSKCMNTETVGKYRIPIIFFLDNISRIGIFVANFASFFLFEYRDCSNNCFFMFPVILFYFRFILVITSIVDQVLFCDATDLHSYEKSFVENQYSTVF